MLSTAAGSNSARRLSSRPRTVNALQQTEVVQTEVDVAHADYSVDNTHGGLLLWLKTGSHASLLAAEIGFSRVFMFSAISPLGLRTRGGDFW